MPADADFPETEHVSPHLDSDRPTQTDFLGFTPYVRAMAEYLAHAATTFPLTISVEGEWGAGKTSFMLQLQHRLTKRGFATVWFDPWAHRQPESLWAAFALTCVKQLERNRRWARPFLKAKLIIKRLSVRSAAPLLWTLAYISCLMALAWSGLQTGLINRIATFLQQLLGGQPINGPMLESLLKIGAFAPVIITVIKELHASVGGLLEADLKRYIKAPDYAAHQDLLTRLHEDFKAVLDTYSGNKPVVVFIDDLDRCAPDLVAEMMQAINLLMTNDPRMVFIIGVDRELVAAAYAARNEKLLPYLPQPASGSGVGADGTAGLNFGLAYLEKFISVPFRLPMLAERSVGQLLINLFPRHPGDKPRRRIFTRINLWLIKLRRGPKFSFSPKVAAVAAGRAELEEIGDYEFTVTTRARKRRARLRVELYEDSDAIHKGVTMVAPLFGYNPRRLKQFLNVLRLRAHMANETGLFDEMEASPLAPAQRPLTLSQLAKLVAISLKWPSFFREVQSIPDGMRILTQVVLGTNEAISVPPVLQRWADNPLLANLLRAGCFGPDGLLHRQLEDEYSLGSVDLHWFAAISPQVLRRGGTIIKDRPWNATAGSLAFWRENKRHLGRVVRAVMRDSAEPEGYFLRLIDEDDNEMWFGGLNAGYSGEGPHGTRTLLVDAGFGTEEELRALIDSTGSFDIQPPSGPHHQKRT